MRHALVTGGGGFIGSHLARRLLDDGWSVDLLDDFSRGANDADLRALVERPEVRLVERDLREPGALDGLGPYELVFHFAAILGVANVLERPYETLRDNTALLVSVLEWARAQNTPPRLVFTSTSEVYAGTLEEGLLTVPTPEGAPIVVPPRERPRTSYMLSKLYGEALCLSSGVPVTIVRPHNFYGPRMGMSRHVAKCQTCGVKCQSRRQAERKDRPCAIRSAASSSTPSPATGTGSRSGASPSPSPLTTS